MARGSRLAGGRKGQRLPVWERCLVAAAALLPLLLLFTLGGRRAGTSLGGLPGQEHSEESLEYGDEGQPAYGPDHYQGSGPEEAPWQELGRLPPEQLGAWRQFAQARQCSLEDADYAQIFRDLAPFRQAGAGPITSTAVEALGAALPLTAVASLGGGLPGVRFSQEWYGHTPFWADLLGEFAPELPPLKILLNLKDEPRSWVAPLPEEAEQLMRNGSLTEEQVWHWLACDLVSPQLAALKRQHGLFASRLQFHARRLLLPVFSSFKIPGCHGDILIPAPQNNPREVNEAAAHSACPISNTSFESKRPVAVWRGSSTGATYHATLPSDQWRRFHRQRLVELSRRHPSHLDAGFVGYVQCAPNQCEEMERLYGRQPPIPTADMYNNFRFQTVVDGNGAPTRLLPTLCSGALTLLSSIVSEWYYFLLQPFKHYLPVRPDYSDLVPAVEWARANPAEAASIARSASELVNSRLRREDAQCYAYRLLLEYADLYRLNASEGGSSASPQAGGAAAAAAAARAAGGAGGGSSGGSSSGGLEAALLLAAPPPSPPVGRGFEW